MKILLLDIETSPLVSYTWGAYDQNIIKVIKEWQILCASWKWLGKPLKAVIQKNGDDKNVLLALKEVMDEADIIVIHNAKFDIPKINTRFVYHNISFPSPYKIVDTLVEARRRYKFTFNKLDYIGKYLKLGQKIDTGGFELWEDFMAGDKKAQAKMVRYNKQDVALLEKVYLRFRPNMPNHPTENAVVDRPKECPLCHSERIQSRGPEPRANNREAPRFQCQDCAKWFYGKVRTKQKPHGVRSLRRT